MRLNGQDLRARLSGYGTAPALVRADGTVVDHAALLNHTDGWAERMGGGRKVFFVEASNDVDSIGAYLACLLNGHPVYLFGKQDENVVADLATRYAAAAFIRPHAAEPFQWRDAPATEVHPDLAVLLSTSGSTGSPKFVKLSLDNVVSNADSIAQYLEIASDDRALTSLAFNYSYGLSVVNSHLLAGASLSLSEASVTDPAFFEPIRSGGATSFAGVPYTFDVLGLADPGWADLPRLRHVTQAGGRLPPEQVRHFADLGRANGWRFYVMYGQTECAPRIAYLPPDRAATFPDCIGIPIPGGAIELRAEDGTLVEADEVPGELVYSGPNVMMGYADGAADLATGRPPAPHRTGDIASRNAQGLYRIVGRLSRFVKPFGLRVNLDELQSLLRDDFPGVVCTGTDSRIVVALPGGDAAQAASVTARLLTLLKLPATVFRVVHPATIPLLSNGKTDYQSIRALAEDGGHTGGSHGAIRTLFSRRFVRQLFVEAGQILGIVTPGWASVQHIYAAILNLPQVDGEATFIDLAGDSLSYVQISIALEQYLGHLPPGWETMTADALEREGPVEQAF